MRQALTCTITGSTFIRHDYWTGCTDQTHTSATITVGSVCRHAHNVHRHPGQRNGVGPWSVRRASWPASWAQLERPAPTARTGRTVRRATAMRQTAGPTGRLGNWRDGRERVHDYKRDVCAARHRFDRKRHCVEHGVGSNGRHAVRFQQHRTGRRLLQRVVDHQRHCLRAQEPWVPRECCANHNDSERFDGYARRSAGRDRLKA